MKKKLFCSPLLIGFIFLASGVSGQVTVTGPVCVVPGTVYQYDLHGSWDSVSTMRVCITGGTIMDSSAAGGCTMTGPPLGAVRLNWNSGTGGSLSVTSSKGNASIHVTVTSELEPGVPDSIIRYQFLDSAGIPQAIVCSPATGGACSPVYRYQWQQSGNAVEWSDIPGSNDPTLSFSTPISQTTYYRRKVTETNSGTIANSNAAMIVISIPGTAR